ncbi:uncharacterized protein FPRO_04230 [Fusarium proliferatum ET1]|uniref:Ilp is an apoptosis inhibitor n=1 Tax=Fusarium proliferatum (strain ET1) TaxID=1227346 RepID=A0A1L7VF89_FUSPR|nr:uncharacterized protein FPRO_04230 [Fusarium proliferatum ET1]CZR39333.1 uncharacterized protein FPRO_04230 [Fusarium proliferatum ET1]
MSTQFPVFQQDQFDIFEWHPKFLSCLRYFIDHAQYSPAVQTVAACVNILLPFQKGNIHPLTPTRNGPPSSSSSSRGSVTGTLPLGSTSITLIPYIRRLIVTGFDTPAVLHGFFGDDWVLGIGRVHESERRNYMFAAKSDNWLRVKTQYDMDDGQTVPFLRPLQNVTEEEIQAAESNWSEWLAMQDWMLGPRAPPDLNEHFVTVKKERD